MRPLRRKPSERTRVDRKVDGRERLGDARDLLRLARQAERLEEVTHGVGDRALREDEDDSDPGGVSRPWGASRADESSRTHVAEVKEPHERLEDLDVVGPAEIVAEQRLVEPRARLQEDADRLRLGLAGLDLEQAVLLEVGQALLGLDVEARGTDEQDPLLVLGRADLAGGSRQEPREGTHSRPGRSAGLDSVGHVVDGGEEDVEADELRVGLLRVPWRRVGRVDALRG